MPWQAVAELADLAPGAARAVALSGHQVLLVRVGDAVHATDAVCPHKYGALEQGTVEGATITCPVHAGTFDLATGRPMPGCEWAGRLRAYPVRVVDGTVELEL